MNTLPRSVHQNEQEISPAPGTIRRLVMVGSSPVRFKIVERPAADDNDERIYRQRARRVLEERFGRESGR